MPFRLPVLGAPVPLRQGSLSLASACRSVTLSRGASLWPEARSQLHRRSPRDSMAHDLFVGASASAGALFCHYDSLNQGTQACDCLLREPPNCAAVGPQEKYQGRVAAEVRSRYRMPARWHKLTASVVAEGRDNAIYHTACNTSALEKHHRPFRKPMRQLGDNSLSREPLRHPKPTFQQAGARSPL